MKKIYEAPCMTVVRVRISTIICGSLGCGLTPDGSLEGIETVTNSYADVKNHSYNVWDDDWSD